MIVFVFFFCWLAPLTLAVSFCLELSLLPPTKCGDGGGGGGGVDDDDDHRLQNDNGYQDVQSRDGFVFSKCLKFTLEKTRQCQ